LIILPLKSNITALAGLIIVGLGCAPIYPAIIHSTPSNFGPQNSQAIIGIQMASAYTGSTLMPPIFGVIADKINIGLYPFYLLFFVVLMIMMSERLNRTIAAVKRTVIE
jgi:fucose permease